ncbi:MAG: type II toxin-antitoxin system VapC family toxin [Euzebyales bacterium]|nr:type II toxin-antitoxin system VapC family toxin [Euzebyales bacterium]MBA3620884.1 type II toxin-antitoxin system VapC family toxin [Euzebyales bacterium]
MILVDTSIWIDHLRTGHATLADLLERGLVLGHPWVVGELALGHLAQRGAIIGLLTSLEQATVATPDEVLTLIDRHELYGLGIGYVDAQLLAATRLTPDAALWTADERLPAAAVRLGCATDPRAPDAAAT